MRNFFHAKKLLSFLAAIFITNFTLGQISVVTEANVVRQAENTAPTNNWVLYTRAGTPASSAAFVNGPATPPMGCGSLHLTTVLGSEKVQLFNYDHVGKSLGAINAISYSTYRTAALNPAQVASLNVEIDFNGPAAGGFSTLVFEPTYNPSQGALVNGVWQNWDAKAGNWWSTQPINGQPAGAAIANLRTWAQIVANNPAATILGGVGINQGSGNNGVDDNVDVFKFDNNTYNFEQVPNNVTNVNTGRTYCTIQSAISDALTLNGHTISVGAGLYNEDVTVSKQLTIQGAGFGTTTVSGPIGGGGSTFAVTASNSVIDGFTITRDGNNVVDWNNPGLNSAGISIQGQAITNVIIRNNKITGNRSGIDINNSNGHSVLNNDITDNRTGLIFRNQTDNMTVLNNFITNNWTVGIVFLDGSVGTNVPVQTAANSAFNNNNISANWYGQVVDRQTGGALPLPAAVQRILPATGGEL